MNNQEICQSCGMPLKKDPNRGGTNADNSISENYCSFCFRDGMFLDEGTSLREKIEKNIQMAVKLGMLESEARTFAESTLPRLKRWSS